MSSSTQQREWLGQIPQTAEHKNQKRNKFYSLKVTLLALLGYAVIFGALLLILSILGGIAWMVFTNSALLALQANIEIFFALLVMIYLLTRALWVKFDSPTGYELNLKDYPELVKELNLLSRILRAPKIHQIILTSDYNASIVQTPRLGLFGWHKNTLFLGLELLMSMTLPQARSVIAHEMGHLSGKHGRFSGWVYRIRLCWYRIMTALEHPQNRGSHLMGRFFDWYSPTFNAYTFALARANEFDADKIAAKLTTSRDTANAIVNCHIVHDLLDDFFWQPFLKQADELEKPNESPYTQLLDFLKNNSFDTVAMTSKLVLAMTAETTPFDTHPTLKDRLKALNCEPIAASEPIKKSAAKRWLGKKLPDIIKDFDQEWLLRNSTKWVERHRYAQKNRSKLVTLREKYLSGLTAYELWQLATLTEEFSPNEDCLPLFEQYSKRRPDDANADFVIGRLMLARNNEQGVDQLTLAMDKQPALKMDAYEWLIYFYRNNNDHNAAKFWQEQAELLIDMNKAADKERSMISADDQFFKPDRQTDILGMFTQRIMNIKGLKHAWLAEKRMRYYPESKTFILVFEKGYFDKEAKMIELIASQLDGKLNCFIVQKTGDHADIAKQVIKVGTELV